MPQITCNICLDVSVSDGGQSLMAKRGDVGSRKLCVQFTDCGKPLCIESDATVLLNIARGEEKRSFSGAVDREGRAVFVLPAFALESEGDLSCDVSAINGAGARLSTASFTLTVEDVVLATADELDGEGEDVFSEWIATETMFPLSPQASTDGYVITPTLNRKHLLDLSDEKYRPGGVWSKIRITLPSPPDNARDAWVLISCHAAVDGELGTMNFDWGTAKLPYGIAPDIVCADFDIICSYSHLSGCWQIGVLQYAGVEDAL